LNELQSVIGFNLARVEEGAEEFIEAVEGDTEAVTDELLPDETVTCWTCGSEVEAAQIETTIDKLRNLSQETVSEINDVEEAKSERRELQTQQCERERLERRQRELEDELEKTEARIETLSERREELRYEIEAIEEEVEALETTPTRRFLICTRRPTS
jgi:DNA repair exonuclease SbcCD ATPase subunit